jgi:peptidoglycan/LPS O-acetylase OafA/YrhL
VEKHAYRADIDGLRCLAVVPVILYHFGIPGFGGGYVGVDIFFVISGYLITGIIEGEIARGDFSILRFYERRVRRILPALFTMLATATVVGFWLLLPADLISFARSAVWTIFFVSNYGFWKETGYFDALASTKPLLHTWSLAVEEQFYLFFPPLLMVLRNWQRPRLLIVMACLTLASLALCLRLVAPHPSLVFFWGPTRVWELGIGAVLALTAVRVHSRAWRELFAGVGLAMILVAVTCFSNNRPPFMLNLLVPCLGAALLLHTGSAGPSTLAARLLGLRPVVFLGVISYSLYLWHWPIFVYRLYVSPHDLRAWDAAPMLLASFLLAALSWRYIERPFRGNSGIFTRARLFQFASLAALLLVASSAGLYATNGFAQRLSPRVRKLLAVRADVKPDRCTTFDLAELRTTPMCEFGSADTRAPKFVLWGDSHAGAIEAGLADWGRRHDFTGQLSEHPGCIPLLGVRVSPGENCDAINAIEVKKIMASDAHVVVLDGLWGLAAEGKIAAEAEAAWALTDDSSRPGETNHGPFARGLDRTVKRLAEGGKHVVIIAAVPEVKWSVPEMLAKIRRFGWTTDIRPSRKVFLARQAFANSQFELMRSRYGATVIYPDRILCPTDHCDVEKSGSSLYFDFHHLSIFGATYVISALDGPVTAAIKGR